MNNHLFAVPARQPTPPPTLLSVLLVLLSIVAGGCASTPETTDAIRVELLDQGFVRADGERLARDEFVFRMRIRCRAARANSQLPPKVIISRQSNAAPKVARDLLEQLLLAGVRNASYGS